MLGFQAVIVGEVAAGEAGADTGPDAADERATLATGAVIVAGPREDISEPERAVAAIGGIRLGQCHGCHRIFSLWPLLIRAGHVDGRSGRIISRRNSLRRSGHFRGESTDIIGSIEGHYVHRLLAINKNFLEVAE